MAVSDQVLVSAIVLAVVGVLLIELSPLLLPARLAGPVQAMLYWLGTGAYAILLGLSVWALVVRAGAGR